MKLFALLALSSLAMAQDHWVTAWSTAQPMMRTAPPLRAVAPAANLTPQQKINSQGFHDQTVRMIVRSSIAGSKLRLKLSSPFGATGAVTVGAAHVAVRTKDAEVDPSTDRAVKFNGEATVVIRPGMVVLSDAIDLAVAKQADLAVSLYFPDETGAPSAHNALRTSWVSKDGNLTSAPSIPDAIKMPADYWLAGVEVLAPAAAATIVAFGDSITEGARSTPDTDHPWPALLSARLAADKNGANIAVANVGIGGNRVLRDGSGAAALARFDRDVLGQAGVKWVMLLEGINDIGHGNTEPVTAAELIGAWKQMIERAHAHGIKAIGCTLTPYEGAGYATAVGEEIRDTFNKWIRTSGAFDAVVDFEAAVRDAGNPRKMRAEFDPGDHLHPNDAGYQAMADSIDLSIFTGTDAATKGATKGKKK